MDDAAAHAEVFRRCASALGFTRVGFAPAGPVARHDLYRAWLDAGFAGEMSYLGRPRDVEARQDPRALLDCARTVITVALSYAHADPIDVPADRLAAGPRGRIARYARGDDYHLVLKNKLRALAAEAARALGRSIAFRPLVDTAPLVEREAAHAGGLGFIAKNTLVIAPGAGSLLLLGELLTDVECAPSPPLEPRCGHCRACLDACPTGAFTGPYSLDARRCISYLTIELPGAIPRELRPLVGDHVFGCDVCQEVCPFNASPSVSEQASPALAPRPGYARPSLRRLLALGAAQFRRWQKDSALRRIHRPQLLRNVCVALGNVGTVEDLPHLAHALSERYPLVRAHAVWAVARILEREPHDRDVHERTRALLEGLRAVEGDAAVLEELSLALGN